MSAPKSRPKPSIGSKFEKTFKGNLYTLEVVKGAKDVAFKLDGVTYATPSAAAKSITMSAVNGWRFWHMD
jgi:hypothetical protein